MYRGGVRKSSSARRFRGRAAQTSSINTRSPLRGGWRL